MAGTQSISRSQWPAGVPRVGEVIDGKFVVERLLGQGGMGAVVAARHRTLGHDVAIKFLTSGNADAVARFLREARASVRLRGEHVARVSDLGQLLPSGTPFMVMECLKGDDLGNVLAVRGPLPANEAIGYVLQACAGLKEAHELGVVHRDIKPSNLFLTSCPDGSPLVKVLDFGISKATTPEIAGPAGIALTSTGAGLGSPSYMSPEQVRSAKDVDFRTDIWSLGVVLYELLSKRLPFEGQTALAVCVAIDRDSPTPLRQMRPDVAMELELVVMRCLEKVPGKRFGKIQELAEALGTLPSTSTQAGGFNLAVQVPGQAKTAPFLVTSIAPGPVTTDALGDLALSDDDREVIDHAVEAILEAPAFAPISGIVLRRGMTQQTIGVGGIATVTVDQNIARLDGLRRHLERQGQDEDKDRYYPTALGVLVSCRGDQARAILDATLDALRTKTASSPGFQTFNLSDVQPEFASRGMIFFDDHAELITRFYVLLRLCYQTDSPERIRTWHCPAKIERIVQTRSVEELIAFLLADRRW